MLVCDRAIAGRLPLNRLPFGHRVAFGQALGVVRWARHPPEVLVPP